MRPVYARKSAAAALVLATLVFIAGCATSGGEEFEGDGRVYTRQYTDSTPIEAVDSLLFAYRARDYAGVYHLTKPLANQTADSRRAFVKEATNDDEWTPALWQIDTDPAYTGDRTSADVMAAVLSDLGGYLYKDTIRFYCFLDGEHWKIAQHDFEGESSLLAPVEPSDQPKR